MEHLADTSTLGQYLSEGDDYIIPIQPDASYPSLSETPADNLKIYKIAEAFLQISALFAEHPHIFSSVDLGMEDFLVARAGDDASNDTSPGTEFVVKLATLDHHFDVGSLPQLAAVHDDI